jgi:multicomponent Na+:H+ antiporter subunit D
VLRAATRIFAGFSGAPGPEITAPTEREVEKDDRPPWLMLLPCAVLLALALIPGRLVTPFLAEASGHLINPLASVQPEQPAPPHGLLSYAPVALTLALLTLSLARQRGRTAIARRLLRLELHSFRALQFLHSGIVCDYIAWMMIGVAVLALVISR